MCNRYMKLVDRAMRAIVGKLQLEMRCPASASACGEILGHVGEEIIEE